MWYFYILQSQKNINYFYKGSTNDLQRRLQEHEQGLTVSNKAYRPFKLIYYEAYLTERAARERETAVKKSGSISVPLIRRIKQHL
mgnify:FL=1